MKLTTIVSSGDGLLLSLDGRRPVVTRALGLTTLAETLEAGSLRSNWPAASHGLLAAAGVPAEVLDGLSQQDKDRVVLALLGHAGVAPLAQDAEPAA